MKKYFVPILYLIIVSCASQGYPSGGPADQEGPIILNISPLSDNLSDNEPITIEFNENIDPNSVLSAIKINQDDNFKLRVYKNKINIKPNNAWDSIIELYISRKIHDYQENKMNTSVTKIYKNASKAIAKGVIKGELVNILNDKLYEIGLYKIIDDNIDLVKKVEADIMGVFEFININYGEYRVAVLEGNIDNFNYNYTLSQYGMQSKDIIINEDILEADLNIMISEPLEKPHIVSAKMLNSNHALLTLSNEYDKSVYIHSNTKSGQYQFGDSIKLNIEHNNRLESYFMPLFKFVASFKKDTLSPEVENSYINKNLYLSFSEPIKLLSDDIFFYDSHPLKHKLLNPFEIEIFLEDNYQGDILAIENLISDYENNMIDSVLNIVIPILEQENGKYGSLKGTVSSSKLKDIVVRMTHLETDKQYFTVINNKYEFIFEKIIPGKYILDTYELKNNNKEIYFSGIWLPYQKAAQFTIYPDYIDIRAHWEIEGIELNYDE